VKITTSLEKEMKCVCGSTDLFVKAEANLVVSGGKVTNVASVATENTFVECQKCQFKGPGLLFLSGVPKGDLIRMAATFIGRLPEGDIDTDKRLQTLFLFLFNVQMIAGEKGYEFRTIEKQPAK
jgi:hypothetical protein